MISRCVVDASVAVKWMIPEIHSGAALRVTGPDVARLAPEHILVEVVNALWNKARRGELLRTAAEGAVQRFLSLPFSFTPDRDVASAAFAIALDHGRTVYDGLYVALALREGCPLVTADLRLYNSLKDAFPETMLWVEDLPGVSPVTSGV